MSGVAGMPLPGWAPELKPCGTLAAHRRHLRRGEPVDESCAQAVTRSWQDRLAAGYVRPSRSGRGTVHVAGTHGKALCGRHPRSVTDDPAGVTCGGCLAILRRHGAKLAPEAFAAALARRAAAQAGGRSHAA